MTSKCDSHMMGRGNKKIKKGQQDISAHYYPGIYAEGYIVFVFPFVCSFVHASVMLVELR